MSETIDAIQERLSPTRLVNDAKESVKDATVGRMRRLASGTNGTYGDATLAAKRVVDAVKANPMPFAIAGAAVTALIARGVMRSRMGKPRQLAFGFGVNKRRLVMRACGAGLACWGAWRASSAARTRPAVVMDHYGAVDVETAQQGEGS
jgi:hypothetical protein